MTDQPEKKSGERDPHPRRRTREHGERPYARIYRIVAGIPRGRVATYGQVARLAGLPGHARQVGYALHNLPGASRVPWQRVINSRGRISFAAGSVEEAIQRSLLVSEGISFLPSGAISLGDFGWEPRLAHG